MARIIRCESPPAAAAASAALSRGRTRVLRSEQQRALLEVEATIERARQRAAELIEQAARQAADLRQRAREEGLAEAVRLVASAARLRHDQLARAEQELTELALGIARKILGAELRLHPEVVAEIVAQALQRANSAHRVLLRVHPADLPHIEPQVARLRRGADLDTLSLAPDTTVARGGCIVETQAGQIDGQIDSQLAAIRAALTGSAPSADEVDP